MICMTCTHVISSLHIFYIPGLHHVPALTCMYAYTHIHVYVLSTSKEAPSHHALALNQHTIPYHCTYTHNTCIYTLSKMPFHIPGTHHALALNSSQLYIHTHIHVYIYYQEYPSTYQGLITSLPLINIDSSCIYAYTHMYIHIYHQNYPSTYQGLITPLPLINIQYLMAVHTHTYTCICTIKNALPHSRASLRPYP